MAGPIERRLSSQLHFVRFGRWPEAVVDERIEQHERDLVDVRRAVRTAIDAGEDRSQVLSRVLRERTR